MTPPSVSVVMPARNAEGTLGESLASLQYQDLGDFEIILVDHASTDGTLALMEAAARLDDRIRVFHGEGSFVEAANLAWRSASGDLIARMDADDIAHPSRLRLQRDYLLSHPELAGCGAVVRICKRTETGALIPPDDGYRRYENWINRVLTPEAILAERFIDSPIPNPTAMLRREVLEAAGGYSDPSWAEDYDLWLRLLADGHRLGKTPETLLDWIDGPGRATRLQDRYSIPKFQEAKAHYLARLESVREYGVVLCGAGPTGKDMARRLRSEGVIVRAFLEVNTRQIGHHLAGIPVLASERACDFLGSAVMLAASGRDPGRTLIRAHLCETGFQEGADFFCVA